MSVAARSANTPADRSKQPPQLSPGAAPAALCLPPDATSGLLLRFVARKPGKSHFLSHQTQLSADFCVSWQRAHHERMHLANCNKPPKSKLHRQAPPDGRTARKGCAARTIGAEGTAAIFAGPGASVLMRLQRLIFAEVTEVQATKQTITSTSSRVTGSCLGFVFRF